MPIKICFFVWLCLCGAVAQASETLTIAVASSLYATMQEQARIFEKEHDVNIRLISGSTGRLYNQVLQGAPYDVFIAADNHRPNFLLQQGKTDTIHDIGQGYLGLKLKKKWLSNPRQLLDVKIQHIAIANPDVAPFGKVTKEVLQKQGLWHVLKDKLVYAQNAMQVKMMVDKGLVDAGFVPVKANQPFIATIPYRGVLLSHKTLARTWLDSIKSNNIKLALRAQ